MVCTNFRPGAGGMGGDGIGDGKTTTMKTLFGVTMSPKSIAKPRGPKRRLTNIGTIFKAIHPIYCPPWVHCLSCDFT